MLHPDLHPRFDGYAWAFLLIGFSVAPRLRLGSVNRHAAILTGFDAERVEHPVHVPLLALLIFGAATSTRRSVMPAPQATSPPWRYSVSRRKS